MTDPPDAKAVGIGADPYRGLVWFILLAGVLLRIYLMFSAHSTHEDFLITLRYVENIAAGHGFVYNAGQRVLGTTTPLYTLVLALFARMGLDPTLCGKLLGIAADALAALFTYHLGRSVGRPVAGIAAAACLCFAPTNLTWSTKGMEVGIVAATAAGTWLAWSQKRDVLAWIGASILVLLRIDGAALAVIMLLATVVRDRRFPWRGVGIFAILIAPWTVFATLYFGSPIPLSATAKLTVYSRMIPGRFPQLPLFIRGMFHNSFGLVTGIGCLLYIVCAYDSWRRLRIKRDARLPELLLSPPLIWIVIYYAGMALSHVVLFGWYFVPPTPIYYLVAMVGISMAAERVGFRESALAYKRIATGAAAAGTLAISIIGPHVAKTLREDQAVEADLRIPIGIWLREHARPDDTLMLEPIGYIGYYSRLKIIDMIGLVSPEALPSYSANVACPEHDLRQRLQPDWLLLRTGELNTLNACESMLPKEQRLDQTYTEVNSWKNPGNPGGAAAFILYKRDSHKAAKTQINALERYVQIN